MKFCSAKEIHLVIEDIFLEIRLTRYWTGKWFVSFVKLRLMNVAETTTIPYKGGSNKNITDHILTPEHHIFIYNYPIIMVGRHKNF